MRMIVNIANQKNSDILKTTLTIIYLWLDEFAMSRERNIKNEKK